MIKRLITVAALVVVVCVGAFAQLAVGGTATIYLDTTNGAAQQIKDDFSSGQNLYYGGFIEYLGRHWAGGLGATVSPWTLHGIKLIDYDADVYLAYHLFKATAFLDPYGKVGLGMLGESYQSKSEKNDDNDYTVGSSTSPLSASAYWFAGLGLGITLRPIDIFAEFAYNFNLNFQFKDGNQAVPSYGGDTPYRFTLGAKLIL